MTGTMLDDVGNPLSGAITISPSIPQLVSATTQRLITLKNHFMQLDANGSFSIGLIPSDESDVQPHGVIWTLTTGGANPTSISFTVPSDQTQADVSQYVIQVATGNTPQYLIGYRGPAGIADDPSMAVIVADPTTLTRAALNFAYVPSTQLVISSTAPTSPLPGTVWINTG
jgi:hypothetical protein